MPSLRLFIAIDTPPAIKPEIAAIRDRLKTSNADVKWEPDEKLHVTLKFFGETDDRLLPQIVSYSRRVGLASPPLSLKYKGVGCFPNQRTPKVIWVGLEDLTGLLSVLQNEIETVLIPLGFEREEKTFHAHVTLGRVKSNVGLQGLLRSMESITFESQPVVIQEISLIKSELRCSGSVYTTLETFPLQG